MTVFIHTISIYFPSIFHNFRPLGLVGGRLQGALSSGSGGGGGGRGAGLAAKLWSFCMDLGEMGPPWTTSRATPRIPPLTHLRNRRWCFPASTEKAVTELPICWLENDLS